MSDREEAEYEVESVVAAKVEAASRSKKAKLVWKYLVRWKGYTPDDDTWEPVESFGGSEDVIEAFWKRSSANGRDIGNMSLFRAGEHFQLIGPPRHKRKSTGAHTTEAALKKSLEESTQEPLPLKPSSKRQRSPETVETSERPTKRSRESTTRAPQPIASSSKPRSAQVYGTRSKDRISSTSAFSPSSSRRRIEPLPGSSEIVPDSDEDNEESKLLRMPPVAILKRSIKEIKSSQADNDAQKQRFVPIVIEDNSPPPKHSAAPNQQVNEESASRAPAHRMRLANPRVKLLDDSGAMDMEGNISTKVRAVKSINAESSASTSERTSSRVMRSKPGPGRNSSGIVAEKVTSSLLTAEKGALKTVKGKYATRSTKNSAPAKPAAESMDIDPPKDDPPPSAEELLKMAGLKPESAEALPDFEDDVAGQTTFEKAPSPFQEASIQKDDTELLRKESLELAKNKLFPPQTPKRLPEVMNWAASTIFGPLSLGSTSTNLEQTSAPLLFLNLDSSVAIPISVSDAYVAKQLHLNQHKASQQVPGKFYEQEAALSLLAAVRATGQSALVTLGDTAAAGDKIQFDLFRKRLEDGDIFVAVAGLQILVFSATSNTLLSSRLNAPVAMLNLPGNILLTHVDVENYSSYADAASKADPRRWSQYVSSEE